MRRNGRVRVAVAVAALVIVLLLAAAWRDVASRIIPNTIVAAIAVIGLGWRASMGLEALGGTLIATAVLFLILLLIYSRRALGGGDVKLAVAMALCFSPWDTYRFVFSTALAGGILSAAYLAMRLLPAIARLPGRSNLLSRVYVIERRRIRRRGPLPYGVAIAAGGCLTLVDLIGRQ